jgi:hypothetical protein
MTPAEAKTQLDVARAQALGHIRAGKEYRKQRAAVDEAQDQFNRASAAGDAYGKLKARTELKKAQADLEGYESQQLLADAGVQAAQKRWDELLAQSNREWAAEKTRRDTAEAAAREARKPKPIGSSIVGSTRVRLLAVVTGKVPLKTPTGTSSLSQDEQVMVVLAIDNQSDDKKFSFRTWGARFIQLGTEAARLTDDLGNPYRIVSFENAWAKPVGQTEDASVYPGKSVSDNIVFELPIAKAKHFVLELPATNFGGEGSVKFEFDRQQIKRLEDQ